MNQRFITQINESPYNAARIIGKRAESFKSNDVSRRIMTENEVMSTNNSQSKQKKSRPSNSSIQDQADISLLIGVQSNKANSNMNNFSNIHININHNKFSLNQKKYFPTLQNKFLSTQQASQLSKYNGYRIQTEEGIQQTSQEKKKITKTPITSSLLHENIKQALINDNRQTGQTFQSGQVRQKKRIVITQYNNDSSRVNHLNLTMIANRNQSQQAQGRGRKDISSFNRNKSTQESKLAKQPTAPKRGNFMETGKVSLAEHSLDYLDHQIPATTTNKLSSATPQSRTNNNYGFQASGSKAKKFLGVSTPQGKAQKVIPTNPIIPKQTRQTSQEQNEPISIIQQQLAKRVHPKVLWDLSDDEWKMFGDRFPIQYDKKKLLGRYTKYKLIVLFRGGFSLVWLGENRKTGEKFAIKQILSNNTHQSHMKEIWFGTYFFENGEIMQKFNKFQGCQNLVRFLSYDVKPQDTWIFYEICGESLGNHLYDLRGENHGNERIYRIHHKPLYQTLRKDNSQLKKILRDLAAALDLLQDQRIVHSDLKTENILIKTEKLNSGLQLVTEIKVIDYGSSFPFDDLKQFSMATPEYMCPEILNYILYENQLNFHQSLLKYLNKYGKPWVIDIWSLGCVILEVISGIPLWMSLKTIVVKKGKECIEYGLFAVKGRVFEKIIERQIEVVSNLDQYIDHQSFGGIQVDTELRYLLKRMLSLNPNNRISPKEIIEYIDSPSKQIVYTQ